MATEVNILFTGICLFLTNKNRVIIGKTNSPHKSCLNPQNYISTHFPYLTYRASQRASGKMPLKTGVHDDEAVLLSGLITIMGDIIETEVKYPGGAPLLPNVVKIADIAPAYTPVPITAEDDIKKIDPRVIAARVDLPYGNIAVPIASQSYWHFFPVKGKSIRMQLAQAVVLTLHVSNENINVTEQPFGGGGATEVVTLKSTGGPIDIVIGNSCESDIVPPVPQTKPPVGPDFDFELQWNIFDTHGDVECPPISYNEGVFANGSFVTLGGGNCPPSQWP
jgi:hypothetical protein